MEGRVASRRDKVFKQKKRPTGRFFVLVVQYPHMISWSAKRKLTYSSIIIGFFALVIGVPAFFYLYEEPTCFDNRQNGAEQGVDCGGGCVKLCKSLELRPVVQWQQTFRISSDTYSAIAYIQNPNVTAQAFQVPYKFTLYDSANKVLSERQGSTYIPPGKNFAIVETGIKIFGNPPARTSFELGDEFTWYASKQIPELVVSNILVSGATSTPALEADIMNTTFTNINRVDMAAILYDADGNAVTGSKTYVDAIPRQSSHRVVFTWPEPLARSVARVEIISVPYVTPVGR